MTHLGDYIIEAVARRTTGKYGDFSLIDKLDSFSPYEKVIDSLDGIRAEYVGEADAALIRDSRMYRIIFEKAKKTGVAYSTWKANHWTDVIICNSKGDLAKLTYDGLNLIGVDIMEWTGSGFQLMDVYDGRMLEGGFVEATRIIKNGLE